MGDLFRTLINAVAVLAIPLVLVLFLGWGLVKKVKVYEVFVEGAKDGFNVAVRIIPYLVAMLMAIGIFRASGAMELLTDLLAPVTMLIGMPPETLPMALMRPWSRFANRHPRFHDVRQLRNDLLCSGRLLRRGEYPQHPARRPDGADRRCGRDACRGVDCQPALLVHGASSLAS
jgi:hypothetical protein